MAVAVFAPVHLAVIGVSAPSRDRVRDRARAPGRVSVRDRVSAPGRVSVRAPGRDRDREPRRRRRGTHSHYFFLAAGFAAGFAAAFVAGFFAGAGLAAGFAAFFLVAIVLIDIGVVERKTPASRDGIIPVRRNAREAMRSGPQVSIRQFCGFSCQIQA